VRWETLVGDRGSRLLVLVAETRRERMRGLLGSAALGPGVGLLLPRTRSVHTVGMRRALTVGLLDRELRILAVFQVPPNRVILPARGVRHVLELEPDTELVVGERFRREEGPGVDPGGGVNALGGRPGRRRQRPWGPPWAAASTP
jgi:uncharacterized membrane protein (UPF0127 family)